MFLPVMVRLLQDHPRVGGEKALIGRCLFGLRGSPPRGRGKEFLDKSRSNCIRITPAWAGKSHLGIVLGELVEDHPRVGGEKFSSVMRQTSRRGSPPRGRGKVVPEGMEKAGVRITPAWAGKRSFFVLSKGGEKDHPRVGGEKLRFQVISARELGSPPRGRGKDDE